MFSKLRKLIFKLLPFIDDIVAIIKIAVKKDGKFYNLQTLSSSFVDIATLISGFLRDTKRTLEMCSDCKVSHILDKISDYLSTPGSIQELSSKNIKFYLKTKFNSIETGFKSVNVYCNLDVLSYISLLSSKFTYSDEELTSDELMFIKRMDDFPSSLTVAGYTEALYNILKDVHNHDIFAQIVAKGDQMDLYLSKNLSYHYVYGLLTRTQRTTFNSINLYSNLLTIFINFVVSQIPVSGNIPGGEVLGIDENKSELSSTFR